MKGRAANDHVGCGKGSLGIARLSAGKRRSKLCYTRKTSREGTRLGPKKSARKGVVNINKVGRATARSSRRDNIVKPQGSASSSRSATELLGPDGV